jgi:hypothetical protein
MTQSFFKAEWSNTLMASTAALFIILLTAAFFVLRTFSDPDSGTKVVGALVEAALLATMVLAYLLSPQGYAIGAESLTIVRRLKPITIPLAEITVAEGPTPGLTYASIRLLGNDGLWGRYGKFRSASLGAYYLYVRSGRTPVLVQGRKKYVIGPERPREFVQALNLAAAAAKSGRGGK